MCCSCLGDDLTIRVSEVAGNSESINLTGKQINVIRRFLPLFSLGIEPGRASEMGGKRSKLYAIPDPLKFHSLHSDLVLVSKGMFVLSLRDVNSRTNSVRNYITEPRGT